MGLSVVEMKVTCHLVWFYWIKVSTLWITLNNKAAMDISIQRLLLYYMFTVVSVSYTVIWAVHMILLCRMVTQNQLCLGEFTAWYECYMHIQSAFILILKIVFLFLSCVWFFVLCACHQCVFVNNLIFIRSSSKNQNLHVSWDK